tara:strand:- start:31054 stop:31461 length:408 start_codon:yes stop_codon:yes gene_type:complete
MDTITSNPKEKLLLGAGLDILHFESKEWLESIAFWKDEVRFFEDLLKKRESSADSKKDYSKLLKNLDTIHTDFLKDLENDIKEHEKLLSRLEKGESGLSDYVYRDKHQQLTIRINTFTTNFKTFKKIIFDYANTL